MSEPIFKHRQSGPYQQGAAILVHDNGGNGLPIILALRTGDPPKACDNAMSISMAELYHKQLGRAIEAAKEAGIKDAGF